MILQDTVFKVLDEILILDDGKARLCVKTSKSTQVLPGLEDVECIGVKEPSIFNFVVRF